MPPIKIRKKPVEVEALHFDGDNFADILDWVGSGAAKCKLDPCCVVIQTLEGAMHARMGWWIIKGVEGEFYPCKPSVFEDSYERVEDRLKYNYTPEIKES